MIEFEIIQGKGETKKVHPFSIPEIDEITVSRFVKFHEEIMVHKPKSLVDYDNAKTEEEKKKVIETIEPDEIVNAWGDHYLRVVQFWTKIPENLIIHLTREQLMWVYRVMTMTLLRHNFDDKKQSFTHLGEVYCYPPAPENNLVKRKDYMKGTRIVDVVEAFQFEKFSNMLSKSEWGALPFIIGILCRKMNEELPVMSAEREKFIAERKLIMDSLPLSEAFNVAFFLTRQKLISKQYSNLFSLLQLKRELTQEKISGTFMVGQSH